MIEPVMDTISGYDHPGYRQDDTAPFDVAALLARLNELEVEPSPEPGSAIVGGFIRA